MVHSNPQADSRSYFIKLPFQIILNFIIRHADVVRAIDIKENLQPVFLVDDAEVVVEKIRAQVLQEAGELFSEKGGFFIIRDNGVDVNDGLDSELAAKICFQLVGEHVGVEKRHIGWHLQMEGHHPSPGAVVMDDEIVHSKNMVGAAHRTGFLQPAPGQGAGRLFRAGTGCRTPE